MNNIMWTKIYLKNITLSILLYLLVSRRRKMSFGHRSRHSLRNVVVRTVRMRCSSLFRIVVQVTECRRRRRLGCRRCDSHSSSRSSCRRFERMSSWRPFDKSINTVGATLVALMMAEVVATTAVGRIVGGST